MNTVRHPPCPSWPSLPDNGSAGTGPLQIPIDARRVIRSLAMAVIRGYLASYVSMKSSIVSLVGTSSAGSVPCSCASQRNRRNDYEGVLGICDATRGYRCIGKMEAIGIGPHDVMRMPGSPVLWWWPIAAYRHTLTMNGTS